MDAVDFEEALIDAECGRYDCICDCLDTDAGEIRLERVLRLLNQMSVRERQLFYGRIRACRKGCDIKGGGAPNGPYTPPSAKECMDRLTNVLCSPVTRGAVKLGQQLLLGLGGEGTVEVLAFLGILDDICAKQSAGTVNASTSDALVGKVCSAWTGAKDILKSKLGPNGFGDAVTSVLGPLVFGGLGTALDACCVAGFGGNLSTPPKGGGGSGGAAPQLPSGGGGNPALPASATTNAAAFNSNAASKGLSLIRRT